MSGSWFKGKKVEETDYSAGTFDASGQKFVPSGSSVTAADVTVSDVGGYWSSSDVEGALQEAGSDIAALPDKAFAIAMGVAL